jgi:hypothetical protein
MAKRISNLPNFISTKYGLSDKCHELNRNMPMRDRVDGVYVECREGEGVVLNRNTGKILGRYVSVDYNKYKLVIE